MSKTQTRKVMQSVASLGPAVCLLKLAADRSAGGESVTDALAMVTAWLALSGFSAAGYGSNHQDISRKWSGVLFGLSNGLASIAGEFYIPSLGLQDAEPSGARGQRSGHSIRKLSSLTFFLCRPPPSQAR